MQRIWVQLCSKNRYEVTILIMHKRKRENWVFIDMINGWLLALLTIHESYRWSSSSGVITISEALLPAQTNNKGGNIELKCTITWLCCPWCEWYWCDLGSICHILIEVDLKINSNSNSKCYLNWVNLHLIMFVHLEPCLIYFWSISVYGYIAKVQIRIAFELNLT